jgi:hypothetical protein
MGQIGPCSPHGKLKTQLKKEKEKRVDQLAYLCRMKYAAVGKTRRA